MYSKLAILGNHQRARAVLLPYEKRDGFDVKQWQVLLQEDEEFMIYDTPIALYMADWLVRQARAALRKQLLPPFGKSARVEPIERYKAELTKLLGVVHLTSGKWKAYRYGSCVTAAYDSQVPKNNRSEDKRSVQLDELPKLQVIRELQVQLSALLQGRKLLYDEWLSLGSQQANIPTESLEHAFRYAIMHGLIKVHSTVQVMSHRGKRPMLRCLRCYETELIPSEHPCRYCGQHCYYCRTCLQMGRARTCALVIMMSYQSPIAQASAVSPPAALLDLEAFGLSDAQQMATTKALAFVHQCLTSNKQHRARATSHSVFTSLSRQFLLWAVTGAGKTEMIFPLVAYMTKQGGRVLLATPRRDVVLELSPRLRKAFPELSIATLYGGSEERWQHGQLVIATTHQLMRFRHAFDLVIIDELDAFPYHGDERLYRVAEQCSTKHGVRLLLSATPPAYLQRELNKGRLAYVKLPVRYHRHPLPVPVRIKTPLIVDQLNKRNIPFAILQAIQHSLAEDAQIFIFLQRIVHTEAYASLLRAKFPNIPIEATSSQDERRSEKVMAFRNRDIRILVTTTILERGVTVPRSHVYICDAEAELFDEASLVQMSGRAGRSGDAPNGEVYFLSQQWNEAQRKAIKQIKSMNQLANEQGYLLPQYRSKRQGERR